MTVLASVVFPVVVIASAVAVSYSLVRFIAEIRRSFREDGDE